MHVGLWDGVLLVVVTLMGTALAYLHQPRFKAFVLMLPLPFSIANLSLGTPVDATHVLALLVLYAFMQGVRLLYRRAGLPILASIVSSAAAYCLIGWGVASVVPRTEAAFWICVAAVLAAAVVLQFSMRDREEPGHRSQLPVWQKLPIILAVVTLVVAIKLYLQGFMTLFPMVSVIGAYEARHSLWTIARKMGLLMFAMLPMLATMRVAQAHFHCSIAVSLGFGWIVYLTLLFLLTRDLWRQGAGVEDETLLAETGTP